MNIDWNIITAIFTAIGSCSTAISILILIITLFYLQRELHQTRIATYAGAYKAVVEILQTEDVREARRYLFVNLGNKPFASWTEKDKKQAEKVCYSYDNVGQMVRYGFLPKE